MRASTAQRELIHRLLKKAGIIDGRSGERLNVNFRPIIAAFHGGDIGTEAPVVDDWIYSLEKDDASKVIDYLKERA